MISINRTAEERTAMLRDRIKSFFDYEGNSAFDVFMSDVQQAFEMAERRGEQRGYLRGTAMSKLTEDEKNALGFF